MNTTTGEVYEAEVVQPEAPAPRTSAKPNPKPTATPPNSPGRQRATNAMKESEKATSYAGQSGAGEPLSVPELKKRVTALLEELEGPVPSQAIPLFAACIDRKFKQFSELTQGDWQRLAMALTSAVDHRKRALRHWDEFCVLVGADPMDHDARNSDWKDLVGSHLTDLGSYTPDTWAVLANHLDRLIVAHRDAAQAFAAPDVTETTDAFGDPFEGE